MELVAKVIDGVVGYVRQEPVRVGMLVRAIVLSVTALGFSLSVGQVAAVQGAIEVALQVWTRARVSPYDVYGEVALDAEGDVDAEGEL